jgi:hypothetical protein
LEAKLTRGPYAILKITALLLGLVSAAQAQRPSQSAGAAGRMHSLHRDINFQGAAEQSRSHLGTYQVSRYEGSRTRTDEINDIIHSLSRKPPRQKKEDASESHPIRDMLGQRNLLAPRSPLAAKSVSSLGRNLVTQPDGLSGSNGFPSVLSQPAGPGAPHTPSSSEVPEAALRQPTSDYYAMGLAKFRDRDFIGASGYFDLDSDAHYDQARPQVAGMIAAYKNTNVFQAYFRLLAAIRRAKNLDDLKIDKASFFPDPRDFERTLNDINIWAKTFPDSTGANMILAYFSWLNGDRTTMLSSVDAAIQHVSAPEEEAMCRKLRDLLAASEASKKP